MEEKAFFQVFPDLKMEGLVNGDILAGLFSNARVTKITSNKEKHKINIHNYLEF